MAARLAVERREAQREISSRRLHYRGGLSAQQSDAEFNALLDASIRSIFEASNT